MSKQQQRSDRRGELWAPRALGEDISKLYESPIAVPPEVDDKIAEAADAHCEAVRARRRIRRWGLAAAVAAACFLVVWVYDTARGPKTQPAPRAPIAGVRDIDRNGRVDILDAFALARSIKQGHHLDPTWDVNQDGTINQDDVDAVARLGVMARAQPPGDVPDAVASAVRFAAVDVYIDAGDWPVAAYQFELSASAGEFKIVGIEGGEHAAFAEPPYYDPAALNRDRVIIAAFNTGDDLPSGKVRVARVHVQVIGEPSPTYDVKLIVVADADGEAITAKASWQPAQAAGQVGGD